MSVPSISSKSVYPRVLNMPVKPAATVMLLLLTASQVWPRNAVSKFGIRSQDPEAPPVYVQNSTSSHAEESVSEKSEAQ